MPMQLSCAAEIKAGKSDAVVSIDIGLYRCTLMHLRTGTSPRLGQDCKHPAAQKSLANPCSEQNHHELNSALPGLTSSVDQSLYTEALHREGPSRQL